MLITVDAGNTRVKLACWQSGKIIQRNSIATDSPAPEFQALFDGIEDASRVKQAVVANVAGTETAARLVAAATSLGLPQPCFMQVSKQCCGLVHGYLNPAQHGVDRWAALVAAHELRQGMVCVVDAGSAVSFDVLDDTGHHLGGCIAPGSTLDKTGLLSSLGVQENADASVLLANNTAGGVIAGCAAYEQGGLAQVITAIQQELKQDMLVLLTGGDAESLAQELPDNRALEIHQDLVMQGLAIFSETIR